MITYRNSLDGVTPDQLSGFFVGWINPPTPETHHRLLQNSSHIMLAVDDDSGQIVGFVNAISDGVLSAYLPLLEVLPDYQKKGVGSELVHRLLNKLKSFYMVDLVCDNDLEPFYAGFGMKKQLAMTIRNFDKQSGTD